MSNSPIVPAVLNAQLASLQQQGKRVVLVTGVFDLLHPEHRNFLAKARQEGDFLLVAIESDARVKALKGPERPVWLAEQRQAELHKIPEVDATVILPEDFDLPARREQLLAEVRPAVLAVSSHSPHLDQKRQAVAKYGGELRVVHQHNPAISTTQILAESSD